MFLDNFRLIHWCADISNYINLLLNYCVVQWYTDVHYYYYITLQIDISDRLYTYCVIPQLILRMQNMVNRKEAARETHVVSNRISYVAWTREYTSVIAKSFANRAIKMIQSAGNIRARPNCCTIGKRALNKNYDNCALFTQSSERNSFVIMRSLIISLLITFRYFEIKY